MADMTDKEAQELFNNISTSMKEDDSQKLSALFTDEAPAGDKPNEEQPNEDQPDEDTPKPDTEVEDETPPLDDNSAEPKDDTNKETPKSTPEDDLRAQLEELKRQNHALKSQAGRVPHIQRRLREFDEKLEALNKAQTSPSSQPAAKLTPKLDEILKGISGTDSELAEAIKAAVLAASEGVTNEVYAKERESVEFLREQQTREYQQAEADRLLDMYPNAVEVFNSTHWKDWQASQPADIQRLANSDNADSVATAFKLYAEAMAEKYPQVVEKTAEVAKPDEAEKAQKIEAERQRKRENTPNVGTPNASGKVALPDDPEALFKKYSEMIRKQQLGE